MAPDRRPASLKRRLGGLVALLVVLLGFVLAGMAGHRLYTRVAALKDRLDRVQALVQDKTMQDISTLETVRHELEGMRRDVRALKTDVAPLFPLMERLAWLPKVGPTVAAAPYLLAMGDHFLDAGCLLLDAAAPLASAVLGKQGNPGSSITEEIVPLLIEAQPRFVSAQDAIEQAVAARAHIDSRRLPSLLSRQLDHLDAYLPALRAVSQGAVVSPVLLGAGRPMTYILIAQNNDELRPTGGFISAVGILTLDNGRITRLDVMDSYAADRWHWDHPLPPEPLLQYMDSQLWVFRDANFWPDFPTSAAAIAYFAERDLGISPDGVIAFDQYALQFLVGGLGSLVVPEYDNDVLTRDNVLAKIRSYWNPPPEMIPQGDESKTISWKSDKAWEGRRKQFMSVLVEAMRRKLEQETSSINLVQLGKAVLDALNEKHVLIHLRPPLGSGLTDVANWGGTIAQTAGDYLFVVDTNMGFNKANGVVTRRLDYAVQIEAGGLARSKLVIEYHNTSTRTVECIHDSYYEGTYDRLMNRCYWNYLRVYTPQGALLIADDGEEIADAAESEVGKQVWARWLVIPTNAKREVVLQYYLPQPVLQLTSDGWLYRLLVQKQPGTDRTPLWVSISLPEGVQVVAASPPPSNITGNVVSFENNLRTDQEFQVVVR